MSTDCWLSLEYCFINCVVSRCNKRCYLVCRCGHVKLGDFGSSARLSEGGCSGVAVGTADYMAPELLAAADCAAHTVCQQYCARLVTTAIVGRAHTRMCLYLHHHASCYSLLLLLATLGVVYLLWRHHLVCPNMELHTLMSCTKFKYKRYSNTKNPFWRNPQYWVKVLVYFSLLALHIYTNRVNRKNS